MSPFLWQLPRYLTLCLCLLAACGEPPKLAVLMMNPPLGVVDKGGQQAFKVSGVYTDASTRDLTAQVAWSISAGGNSASIDASGLATGLAEGTATVTATYEDKSASATLQVKPSPVTSLSISPLTPVLAPGVSVRFSARAMFADGTSVDATKLVTWSNTDVNGSNVVSVNNSGVALANSSGTSDITASYLGKSASTRLTVSNATLVAIVVTPASGVIGVGLETQFKAVGNYSDGTRYDLTRQVLWSITDTMGSGVASIDGSGRVLAKAAGKAQVSASLTGKSASVELSVTNATLQSLTVTPSTAAIARLTAQRYTATASLSDGSVVDITQAATWSATDVSGSMVAAVEGGIATGQAAGQAAITVTFGGKMGTAALTVKDLTLSSLQVTPATASIYRAESQSFQAEATFSDNSKQDVTDVVSWTTSDNRLVPIDAAGQATGVQRGQVTITASYLGKMATAQLIVNSFNLGSGTYTTTSVSNLVDTCNTGTTAVSLTGNRSISYTPATEMLSISAISGGGTLCDGLATRVRNQLSVMYGPVALTDGACRWQTQRSCKLTLTADNQFSLDVIDDRSNTTVEAGMVCMQPVNCQLKFTLALSM